jgi:hypothetical protein
MRARKLQTFLVGAIALLALGACENGDGGSGGRPDNPPSTSAADFPVTDQGSTLTKEQLDELCQQADASADETGESVAYDNNYAEVVGGLTRSLAKLCSDRENR